LSVSLSLSLSLFFFLSKILSLCHQRQSTKGQQSTSRESCPGAYYRIYPPEKDASRIIRIVVRTLSN